MKFAMIYLRILPFFLSFGIVLFALRIMGIFENFAPLYYSVWLVMDILLLFFYRAKISKCVCAFNCMLIFSLVIGVCELHFNRHLFTDFLLPLVFFLKIHAFEIIFQKISFEKFVKDFSRTTMICSALLLPLVYWLVMSSSRARMSIYVPLDLTFAYNLLGNHWLILLMCVMVIFSYGQRAMLVGVFSGFFWFFLSGSFKAKFKIILLLILLLIPIFMLKDSPVAVRAFSSFSIEDVDNLNSASAGRLDEIIDIIANMKWYHYILGRGCGASYEREIYINGIFHQMLRSHQCHFSPLSFVFKYGSFFTLLLYSYCSILTVKAWKQYLKNHDGAKYLGVAAIAMAVLLVQTMFSYMLLTSYFPLLAGYCLAYKKISLENLYKNKRK